MNTAEQNNVIMNNAVYVDFSASKVAAEGKGYKEIKFSEKSMKGTLASIKKLNEQVIKQTPVEEKAAPVQNATEEQSPVEVTKPSEPVQQEKLYRSIPWTAATVYGAKGGAKQLNTKQAVTAKITNFGDVQIPEHEKQAAVIANQEAEEKVEATSETAKKLETLKAVAEENIEVNNKVVEANTERDSAKATNEAAIEAARQAEIEKIEAAKKEENAKRRKQMAIESNLSAQKAVDATTQRLNEFRQTQVSRIQDFKAETSVLKKETKEQQAIENEAKEAAKRALESAEENNKEAEEYENKTRELTTGLKEVSALLNSKNVPFQPINIDEIESKKSNEDEEAYSFRKIA